MRAEDMMAFDACNVRIKTEAVRPPFLILQSV